MRMWLSKNLTKILRKT